MSLNELSRKKLKGLYVLPSQWYESVYDEEARARIEQVVDIYAPQQEPDIMARKPALLKEAEVIFSTWGAPQFNEQFLAATPQLKGVFYAAGSIKNCVTDAFWKSGAFICSAYAANAIPVIEFTYASILLSAKNTWRFARKLRREKVFPENKDSYVHGMYDYTVGIVSLGMIGKGVCRMLQNHKAHILAYDPYVSSQDAQNAGVKLSSLEELFSNSNCVSIHTPWLPETEGMIRGEHIRMMGENATFINTSRGAVVNEKELIEALNERPDITAILDVTWPEPPAETSPLYEMENVILTPHIAGSMSHERRRLGLYMAEEVERYVAQMPLKWSITQEMSKRLA